MIYFAVKVFAVMNRTGSIDLKEIVIDVHADMEEIAMDADMEEIAMDADMEEIAMDTDADVKGIVAIDASAEGVAIYAIIADRAAVTQGHAIQDGV